jgi:ammonium transporter, Amt family
MRNSADSNFYYQFCRGHIRRPQKWSAIEMSHINTGDTAFMMICTALVMLMTPGLAFFYAGMVRRKNVLATMMHSFILLGLVSVQWVLIGYSLSFGPDKWHFIGGLDWLGLRGVGMSPNKDYAATIPHMLFMAYQMMFAVITPALISGTFAERFKFKTYIVFMLLWCFLVYDPVCHWVWGIDGWIRNLGALDFAGGTVVHINAGVAALAAAILVGRRRDIDDGADMSPHNLPLTLIGTGLLWFGWFGFNAGSALTAGTLAVSAFVATHIATAAAALSWAVTECLHRGKPTTLGVASGAVAGLVAITPAAGFVGPLPAMLIGFGVGAVCYGGVQIKSKFRYDDSLDVVGVHGLGGAFGAIMTGLFASKLINSAGANGLFYGNVKQFFIQLLAVGVTLGYSFIVTFALLKILDRTMGLRVKPEEEDEGLDLSQHNEMGYSF